MSSTITNYDGGITTSPQQLVYVESVEQIQSILKDTVKFPSPVRAMGSYHSLTPCASSDGTILNMSRMNRVLEINRDRMTFTAQAGLEFIEANHALRAQGLQFITNIEIARRSVPRDSRLMHPMASLLPFIGAITKAMSRPAELASRAA